MTHILFIFRKFRFEIYICISVRGVGGIGPANGAYQADDNIKMIIFREFKELLLKYTTDFYKFRTNITQTTAKCAKHAVIECTVPITQRGIKNNVQYLLYIHVYINESLTTDQSQRAV